MIGYIFLAASLLFGVIKGYCGKRTGGAITHASDAMIVNTVRMIFCTVIGVIAILVGMLAGGAETLVITPRLLLISALAGVGTAAFTVSWLLSVRKGAYMLVEVFVLLSITIPIILCNVLFGEPISIVQWIGIALLVVAGYIMCTYNQSLNGKITLGAILLLILISVSNGAVSFSHKLFSNTIANGNAALFNLLTYIFAAIALSACAVVFRKAEKGESEHRGIVKTVQPILIYVAVMAVCLFLHSFFDTLAATKLDAVYMFPLHNGGALILSMLMSTIIFKEKINAKCIIGVCMAFAALLIINFSPLIISLF